MKHLFLLVIIVVSSSAYAAKLEYKAYNRNVDEVFAELAKIGMVPGKTNGVNTTLSVNNDSSAAVVAPVCYLSNLASRGIFIICSASTDYQIGRVTQLLSSSIDLDSYSVSLNTGKTERINTIRAMVPMTLEEIREWSPKKKMLDLHD